MKTKPGNAVFQVSCAGIFPPKFNGRLGSLLLSLTLLCTFHLPRCTFAQGTAFTYQGRLTDNGAPANGSYDLTFALFTTNVGPVQIGPTITNAAVALSEGLFTVALDFGAGSFPGAERWLEIGVRTNGMGGFITLVPRQKLTPSPYAITAGTLVSGGLA